MRVGTKSESVPERLALAAGLIPTPLLESFEAMAMARAIMAGVSLGIFDALDEQPDDADRLARRLKLDPRGTDILLVALHALGYVEHRGDGVYRNSPAVEKFALRGQPARRSPRTSATSTATCGTSSRAPTTRSAPARPRASTRAIRTTRTGSATCAACST